MRLPDLSFAIRHLVRRPGFAAAAILLLAVSAGANASIFSVVRGVLFRPLPFPQPDRLVAVWPSTFVSNEEVAYWRARTRSFDRLATLSPGWLMGLVADGGEPVKITAGRASDDLFVTLGAPAALGRVLAPGDSVPGRHRVVVLSDGLWRTRFGADPAIVGRGVQLDQEPYVVVGVMPPGFEIFAPGTDAWTPLIWDPSAPNHKTTFSLALGRLASGATPGAAAREIAELAPEMRRALGKPDDWGRAASVLGLQESTAAAVRPALLLLMGAVWLMHALAVVNLGTLMLGRSVERMGEMALRTALGASRGRVIRQLVVEQAVLSVIGVGAGLLVARGVLPVLIAYLPPDVPRIGQIALDSTVLAIILVTSVLASVVAAIGPALLGSRVDLQAMLRQGRSTESRGRRRALGALVAVQVAMAVVLGIGSVLMLRSLWTLQAVDPGFSPDHVLTFRLQTTSNYRALGNGLPFLEQVRERVAALPGVERVGLAAHLPMSGYAWTTTAQRADLTLEPGRQPPTVGWRFVHGDYFAALRVPLRFGRTFSTGDRSTSPPVMIVNDTLARQYFGDSAAAVGRSMIVRSGRTGQNDAVEIVGVVGDVRHLGLNREPVAELYRPLAQTFMFPMAMVVRTTGPPEGLAAAVRQIVFAIDPAVPVADLQTFTALVAGTLERPRLLSRLLAVFAVAGLALGLCGVYAVVAYRVRQREREIGILLALGARPADVVREVLAQGARHGVIGVALGVPAAFLLARLAGSLLFGVTTSDRVTFTLLPLAIVVATTAASYLPARRASRIDPAEALKADVA